MEILARRAVNFAALSLVLIFCPGLGRAQSSSGMFDATTPVMNSARANATATLLANGKVLIAGGFGDAGALSSTELYDPATNTFAPSNSTAVMNSPRANATATLLPNGKVLIAGGQAGGSLFSLSSTELYDPATNTFAPPASTPMMNSGREAATATLLLNGKVLIAGGQLVFQAVLGSTELYDPAANTFAPANSTAMMGARVGATATLLGNGKVLIAGGQNLVAPHLYGSLSSTNLYDPDTNTFAASSPKMNTARDSATATLLPNGKVLIAGGRSLGPGLNSVILSSTELYSPVSITNPAADSTVSGTVAFTCTDTPDAVVYLYIDDVYVAAGNSPFTFSWDTTAASNGSHYLVCNGYVNGSTNGSAAENVTVSNVSNPPQTVSITNPAANSTVSATVPFSCTDTAPNAVVILYIDDVYVAAGNSPLTFSWDTTAASNGSHYLVCNGYVNGSTNGSAAQDVTVSN
jgi:hypothetical protein